MLSITVIYKKYGRLEISKTLFCSIQSNYV